MDKTKINQYIADLDRDYSQSREQRERSREELRFGTVEGAHWEGALGEKYENRAKMEVDMVSEFAHRTYAYYCDNRITVNYSPDDSNTNQEDADLMDGLWRRDSLRRGGHTAIDHAAYEAIYSGMGAFMFTEEYEDEDDPQNMRQNLVFQEIPEAYRCVMFDSSARKIDKSDAKHVTILTPYHKDDLAEMYPDQVINNMDRLGSHGGFLWQVSDLIYIATRYHIEKKAVLVNFYSHPMLSIDDKNKSFFLEGDQIKLDHNQAIMDGYELLTSRKVKRKRVYKTVFCQDCELEKTIEIKGDHLPVIPMYAYRSYVEGQEHYYGVIRKRMDSQRLLDMSFSLAAEAAAYSGQRKPIFTPEQMSSQLARRSWAASPHTIPYRLVDPIKDQHGNMTAFVAGWDEGGGIAPAAAALIDMSSNHILQGTAGAAQDTIDPDASGKAINASIKRSDQNTRIIFDNFKKAIIHAGNVYASKARAIYGSKENRGRTMQLMNDKEQVRAVKLFDNKPDIRGIYTANDPSQGKYQVVAGVSKGYDTQAEETIEVLKDIAISLPDGHQLKEMAFGKIIQLLPNSDLDDMKWFIRKQELQQGAKPETEEEMQFIQQIQQSQAQQGPDANTMLLEKMAMEQETEAMMNAAKIKQMDIDNLKTAAEIENKQADTVLKLREARQRLQ